VPSSQSHSAPSISNTFPSEFEDRCPSQKNSSDAFSFFPGPPRPASVFYITQPRSLLTRLSASNLPGAGCRWFPPRCAPSVAWSGQIHLQPCRRTGSFPAPSTRALFHPRAPPPDFITPFTENCHNTAVKPLIRLPRPDFYSPPSNHPAPDLLTTVAHSP